MLTEPMHVADDARHVESPPFKRAAIEVKMQVGILLSVHRDGALHMGHRGLPELIRFHRAGHDMGPMARAMTIGSVVL